VGGPKSGKGVLEPLRFPGVVLKTEYSSAKRGVHPVDSSKRPWLCLGVSKMGLGKTVDIGVRLGVGGWAVESPKLEDQLSARQTPEGNRSRGALDGKRERANLEPSGFALIAGLILFQTCIPGYGMQTV
jgi:hypothetical protein